MEKEKLNVIENNIFARGGELKQCDCFSPVYETTNYEYFKISEDKNRNINLGHVRKIKNNIIKNGYVKADPIIVDSFGFIVDGQHRFSALKELGLPIVFQIVNNLNDDACKIINQTSKNWETIDYIQNGVKSGNKKFINLYFLMNKYACKGNMFCKSSDKNYGKITKEAIYTIIQERGGYKYSGRAMDKIRNGEIRDDIEEVEREIKFYISCFDVLRDSKFSEMKHRANLWFPGFSFVYKTEEIDNDLFIEKLKRNSHLIPYIPYNEEESIKACDKVYKRNHIILKMYRKQEFNL